MNRYAYRAGWVKYGLLTGLVAIGGAGGLYLSGGWPGAPASPPDLKNSGEPAEPAPPVAHRFPLSALDAKDTIETPSLAADSAGVVFLTWASKTAETERTLFLTRTADGGRSFDAPKMVGKGGVYKTSARGKAGGYERRATPHLAADGGRLHLAWGEALPDGSGQRMVLATSTDAGATFTAPRPVHRAVHTKVAFTAFTPGPGGMLACSWLDDRAGSQQPFASVRRVGAEGFEPELVVHPGQNGKGVCPCCPTAACFAPDGTLYVAFRNVTDGYRDIAVGRLRPGQGAFDGPFPVVSNTWKFDGCPHDGPSLAVVGDALHVVWMDGRSGVPRGYHARAGLAEMKFEARELRPGAVGTQGNPRLFADASGGLHAVWEESLGAEPAISQGHTGHQHGPPKVGAGGGRAIVYAHMPAGAGGFGPARAVAPRPGAFQTRPTVTGTAGGDLFAAWMELDESGKAVVATRLAPGVSRE
ncbi:MAG: exo-alpha-sialidase [Gemmataceae bacterium]|nr:exo-alpha-sialidase [Gemmataceae bacterium]